MSSTSSSSTVPSPAPIPPPGSKIWTTLLTNLDYLPGLLVLDYSLKLCKTRYPLLVFYTSSFPQSGRDALDRRRIPRKEIGKLQPKKQQDFSNEPRFYEVWSKLYPFSMTEYSRVVLLDSDMQVLRNMDELMDLELDPPEMAGKGERGVASTHACVCNPLKKKHYPADWIPENCAFTHQHSDPDLAQTHGAANSLSTGMMNTGIVVLNPSAPVYEKMLELLNNEEVTSQYKFPDQALISEVYTNRWVPLPYVYNALKTMRKPEVHGKIWRDDEVKNVHFILAPKPWDEKVEEVKEETHLWWHKCDKARREEEAKEGVKDEFS